MGDRFTPKMYVEWWAKEHGRAIEDFGVSPIAVVSWQLSSIQTFAETTEAKIPEHWFYGKRYPLYNGQTNGRSVSFAYLPVGAPGTVMMMEEIIASGARVFIGFGYAGSLQENLPTGGFIIPTPCAIEEGTSLHYVDKNTQIGPNKEILKIIEESLPGSRSQAK